VAQCRACPTGFGLAHTRVRLQTVQGIVECLPKLTRVDLSGCHHLDDTCLQSLATLHHLQRLDLRGCEQTTDACVPSLRALTSLQHLDLHGCYQLTGAGVQPLRAHLLHLDVGGATLPDTIVW
jgi:hypothetical protein